MVMVELNQEKKIGEKSKILVNIKKFIKIFNLN